MNNEKKPWKLRVSSPAPVHLNNPVTAPVSQDSSKAPPFCWWCKGPHAPNSCPQGGPAKNKNFKGQQCSNAVKGNHDNHPTVSTVTHMESVY